MTTTSSSPSTTTHLHFNRLLRNSTATPFLFEFLASVHAENLLDFWHEVEEYKALIGRGTDLLARARKIIETHFAVNSASFLSQDELDRVRKRFEVEMPCLDLFNGAQREVAEKMRGELFQRFQQSHSYEAMLKDKSFIPSLSMSIHDYLRDPYTTRTLKEYLHVEHPNQVRTLSFVLMLRNIYAPRVAAALAPLPPDVQKATRMQKRTTQARELLDQARRIVDEFLHQDKVVSMVALQTASRIRAEIKSLSDVFNLTESTHAQIHANNAKLSAGHTLAKQLDRIVTPAPGYSQAINAATSSNSTMTSHATAMEDIIRGLADLFSVAGKEALTWLENTAVTELEVSDFHLPLVDSSLAISRPQSSTMVEGNSSSSSDAPSSSFSNLDGGGGENRSPPSGDVGDDHHDQLLVWPLTSWHQQLRTSTTRTILFTTMDENIMGTNEVHQVHMLMMSASKSAYSCDDEAIDFSGTTVSCKTKGIEFRTRVERMTSLIRRSEKKVEAHHHGAAATTLQIEKTPTLAGVSTSEAGMVARLRKRLDNEFDPDSLACIDLHNYVFPLGLRVDVQHASSLSHETMFAGRPPPIPSRPPRPHSFIIPCARTNHSTYPHLQCRCLYGTCMTRYVKRTIHPFPAMQTAIPPPPPASAPPPHVLPDMSRIQSVSDSTGTSTSVMVRQASSSGGAGGGPLPTHRRSSSRALRPYLEYDTLVTKVPGFGIGLNLAVNLDGSVVAHKYVSSDTGVPSPAAAKGAILIEDELIAINGISVHGRRFADDIVAQIRHSLSPVALRFSRGSLNDSLSSNNGAGGMDDELTIRVPEVVVVLSTRPYYHAAFDALEDWGYGINDDVRGFVGRVSPGPRVPDLQATLFDFLSVDNVVDVLSAILLERRVLLVSDHPQVASRAFEALMFLLYPFSWRGEWCSLLPETHLDWFANRVGDSKPFFASYCTADLCPPTLEIPLKRQGRFVMRDEPWTMRERDVYLPSERVLTHGSVKSGLLTLVDCKNTIIVDLDGDVLTRMIRPALQFPADIRDELIFNYNIALGRGGIGSDFGREGKQFLQRRASSVSSQVDDVQGVDEEEGVEIDLAMTLRHVTLKAYQAMLNRTHEFAVTIRADVMAFHRAHLLKHTPLGHYDWVHKFTLTRVFEDFVSCGWVFGSSA